MARVVTIERSATAPAQTGPTLLAFADAGGVPRGWRLVLGGAVIGRGDEVAELPEQRDWVRVVLAVPGTDVTIRWLDLADSLTPAQAATAARLQIADETAEPLADLAVTAGRPEAGLTPIALTPADRIAAWVEAARALAMEPDVVIPAPMLLMPPGEGLVRLAREDGPSDYRGQARAFSMEPELAQLIVGDDPVRDLDDNQFEAGLGPALANPVINLRQGVYARRRERVLNRGSIRRLVVLGIILLLISILIEVTTILRTVAATDEVTAQTQQVLAQTSGPAARATPARRFGALASALLDVVRETPSAEVREIVYQPDGSLRVTMLADVPATLDALRARLEGRGVQAAAGGAPAPLGTRFAGDIVVRAR